MTTHFRGNVTKHPVQRLVGVTFLYGLVLPFSLAFRMFAGRLPKGVKIEHRGGSL